MGVVGVGRGMLGRGVRGRLDGILICLFVFASAMMGMKGVVGGFDGCFPSVAPTAFSALPYCTVLHI